MKRALAGLALALALAPAAAAAIPVDTIALEMKPLDARVLFNKDPYDRSSFPVTVLAINGESLNLHGRIEVKGSLTRASRRKSVLIKLTDGKWHGKSRLSYNGMGTDATLMREHLSWELMRTLGMVVPATRYTRMSINGQEHGLFLNIEWIDASMFERAGLGGDGEMYHPQDLSHCGDLTPESMLPSRRCWVKLAPFGDKDFGTLRALTEEIAAEPVDTFDRLLERRFDAASVIDWFAVNTLVGLADTYNKNYFLYLSRKSGRWLIVPWDYDLTFGRSFDPTLPYPSSILNERFQYYAPPETGQSNPLHYQALKNARFRGVLADRVRELIDGTADAAHPWRGWFAPQRMRARIDELRAAIAPELDRAAWPADERRKFEDEVESLNFYVHARVKYLRRTLLGRAEWARDSAAVALRAGEAADAIDGWGFMLAQLRPRRPGPSEARVAVLRGPPELAPAGADRAACVQRTWLVTAPGGVVDLMLTYLDENGYVQEVGAAVRERELQLYAAEGAGWRPLHTAVAPVANTLRAEAVQLPAQGPARFVACTAVAVASGR